MAWGLRKREPDFVIGSKDDPYMRRWFILPRNRWFNIYLHNMKKSDYDRALHDHPSWNVSIVLKGGYLEHVPGQGFGGKPLPAPHNRHNAFWRGAGSIVFRRAKSLHRLDLQSGQEAWSLFINGPKSRIWGFACTKGWVPFHEMVETKDGVSVTKGCPD